MVKKPCVECRHFRPDLSFSIVENGVRFGTCSMAPIVNLVTGVEAFDYCSIQRTTGSACGPAGANFQPKDEPHG